MSILNKLGQALGVKAKSHAHAMNADHELRELDEMLDDTAQQLPKIPLNPEV